MKKLYFILPVLILSLVAQACKTSKGVVDSKETILETPKESEEYASKELPIVSDTIQKRTFVAGIERTFCFGRCPTYTMEIYSDGFVEFNGTRNVEIIGKYTTNITQVQINEILGTANDINFFEMDNEYDDPMVMDLPSATTTIMGNGVKKSVMRRIGYPDSILALEKHFDNLIKSERWTSESGEIYPPER
ncbi:MAG: DUF6438 domain-containing protein [Crocinitomicaceae bacterium]|nr:DUF6438 domain-containing protein [Crocinitomicaceae bacterium]